MKKKKKDLGISTMITGIAVVFIFVVGFIYVFPNQIRYTLSTIGNAGIQLASVILSHNFRSVAEIQSHYNSTSPNSSLGKVRILLVPGHEPNFGGAKFADLKERDMTVELAQDLQKFLAGNSHYQVFITRDTQAWDPVFSSYFNNGWSDIVEWTQASHDEFSRLVAIGSTTRTYSTVRHNKAPEDVALRLFGIAKWSDENNIDIAIHIHFNDNTRGDALRPGKYSGFAIYVPASQYGNSTTTKVIADSIFKRLSKYDPVSDLPGETSGIIDEPELIAIGANNTADAASMLIEYSYIYEPQFQSSQVRSMAINDLAFQTYLGLQDFFDPNNNIDLARSYDTLILPYKWSGPLVDDKAPARDVFALQTALMFNGVYPPSDKSKNDCPRTGTIGACTRASLQVFQSKYGISGEDGMAGQKTLHTLSQL